jgi:hypothetical protein
MGGGIRMDDEEMNEFDRGFWDEAMKRAGAKPTSRIGVQVPKAKGRPSSGYFLPQCRHWRQKFELEGGIHVFASAWMDKPMLGERSKKVGFSGSPDIGFYLDDRWASGSLLVSPGFNPPFARKASRSRMVLFPWEDWGIPENPRVFHRAVRWLLSEAEKGQKIEVACMGGHGRTGTALATMLVVQGLDARTAMRRVRRSYCEEAIESDKQIAFLRAL